MVPAGWYGDPWQRGYARYWDGAVWTPHARSLTPPAPTLDLVEERRWARLAGFAMWLQAACGLATAIAVPLMFSSMWDTFTDTVNDDASLRIGRSVWLGAVSMQIVGLLAIAATAVLAVWSHRATANTRALGRWTTHSPGWAAASWFVPIVKYWFPYQATRDLVPPDHPIRPSVGRWWALHIGAPVFATVAPMASLLSLELGLGIGLVGGAISIARAAIGSRIASSIAAEHEAAADAGP